MTEENIILIKQIKSNTINNTEMHGGKSVWNSLAVPATVKSERHPV